MAILYLGLDPSRYKRSVVHFPVIQIVPRNLKESLYDPIWKDIGQFTHVLFTSRNSVKILCDYLLELNLLEHLKSKKLLSIGSATSELLSSYGFSSVKAQEETAEGMTALLQGCLDVEYVLYLHSSRARALIGEFLKGGSYRFFAAPLYDTSLRPLLDLPDLREFDEIVFTSPSTIDAFLSLFKQFPKGAKLTSIGPITSKHLLSLASKFE